jgi:hypothetical protein
MHSLLALHNAKQPRSTSMSKEGLFMDYDERVRRLTREYDRIPAGDPRRVEMENEISALYLEQHNAKNRNRVRD